MLGGENARPQLDLKCKVKRMMIEAKYFKGVSLRHGKKEY